MWGEQPTLNINKQTNKQTNKWPFPICCFQVKDDLFAAARNGHHPYLQWFQRSPWGLCVWPNHEWHDHRCLFFFLLRARICVRGSERCCRWDAKGAEAGGNQEEQAKVSCASSRKTVGWNMDVARLSGAGAGLRVAEWRKTRWVTKVSSASSGPDTRWCSHHSSNKRRKCH